MSTNGFPFWDAVMLSSTLNPELTEFHNVIDFQGEGNVDLRFLFNYTHGIFELEIAYNLLF